MDDKYLDSANQVQGRKRAPDGGLNRMLKFDFRSSTGEIVQAIEYRHLSHLKEVKRGDKFLLQPIIG